MHKLATVLFAMATVVVVAPKVANSAYYAEYYRDNLFLGLAYHRVACLTDWTTIQSNMEWDGFTTANYCNAGTNANSVPNGEWFDWNYATGSAQLDSCGAGANNAYGTPNYQATSNTCSYNVLYNCNSDCWIRNFSSCQGKQVAISSPCW